MVNQVSTAIRNAQLFDYLRAKQRQLQLVLQNNSDALITLSPDFTVTLLNPKAYDLFKNPPNGEIVGQRLDRIDPSSIYPDVVRNIRYSGSPYKPISFQIRDEDWQRDYSIDVTPLIAEDSGGENLGYVITIHDVTSLKDFDRLKTRMLRILTHDIKTPLNIIWGYVDFLRSDSEQNLPADPEFLTGILDAMHKIDHLVEETLNAERMIGEGAHQEFFSPEVLLQEALENNMPTAEKKHLRVSQEVQPDMPQVWGSTLQIREAMHNLMSNAIKYTPENGMIVVRAQAQQGQFAFEVQDNGLGIPDDLQDKLFKDWYRADRPEIKSIEGTGLGLSLVKGAIESHEGEVWFKSKVGEGSTFGFWLPVAPPEDDDF